MVEAVGVRDGTFSFNRRVAEALSIVPADPAGAQIRQPLQTGWNGRWQAVQEDDQIRRGLWGGYAKVHVQVLATYRFPDLLDSHGSRFTSFRSLRSMPSLCLRKSRSSSRLLPPPKR